MMKAYYVVLLFCVGLIACNPKQAEKPTEKEMKVETPDLKANYPSAIWDIFEAHGSLHNWRQYKSLIFETGSEEEGWEKHSTDLNSRLASIEASNYSMGYDGSNVWIKQDTAAYKGDPRFYYNLMFYFYAMPFILGDEGIQYTQVDPVTIQDQTYEGIKVSYNAGVGTSPEDEYIVYYDPATKKMHWLAYTVTYFSKEKSENFNIVHYTDWAETNGLLLPTEMAFYRFPNNQLGEARGSSSFKGVQLSKEMSKPADFQMPEGAKVIE